MFRSNKKHGFSPTRYAPALVTAVVVLGAAAWLFLRPGREADNSPTAAVAPKDSIDRMYVPPSDEEYVGSAACAACHGEIAAAYKTHPMSRSMSRIGTDVEAETPHVKQTRVDGRKRVLEVETRPGELVHHERMFDAAGDLIYDCAVPMDFVMGSGRRGKAYLYQRGSLLFMSPLNWYSQSQRWDLAPGYVADDPRRFDRRIRDECLSCHVGRMAPEGRSLNTYSAAVFREQSIGCENCHGPGERHVTLRESGVAVRAEDDPIVNPSRLDPVRRDSVCYQCHLQAAVRLPRPGRSDFDFRPGQRVEDIWTFLDAANSVADDGRTRAVSHVQQMRASRCYTQSAGRFGCISCHDPHRVPADSERTLFYREKCLQCHDDSETRLFVQKPGFSLPPPCSLSQERRLEKGDSCVVCHMPAQGTNNVSHVTQTDHRVLRTPRPAENNRTDDAFPDELSFFGDAHGELEGWERERALGVGAWLYLTRKGRRPPRELAPVLLRVLEKVPDDGIVLMALGELANEHQLGERARDYFEQARKIPQTEEAALSRLLDIYRLSADRTRALECAERALQIDPGMVQALTLKAELLFADGRSSEAIEAAERALELNPTLVRLRQWLAEVCRDAGRIDKQLEQEQIIRRMQDARPPAR